MGAVSASRPQPSGLFGHPGLLAAGAAGCLAAILSLWAIRALPMGTVTLWLTGIPLFMAGLGFGVVSATLAALVATLLIWLTAGGLPALVFLGLFGVPVPLLLAAGLRGGALRLGWPLALLGLWPVAVLLLTAGFLTGDGGIEAAMRAAVTVALARLDIAAPELLITELVRIKAAAIGFWAMLALLANATAAAGFLDRRGLLAVPKPDWAAVRLPGWYPVLPAAAAALFLAAPAGADAVPLSALLLLLVPLFLQGVAGVHTRLRARPWRRPLLAGFYLLLVLFLQIMGPGLIGLGLYDQFQRRATPRQS